MNYVKNIRLKLLINLFINIKMSTSDFDEAVINLNILSSIEPNKKITTKDVYLNIEVNNMFIPESIKRWYRGDDRNECVKAIDKVIIRSIKLLNNYPELEEYLEKSIKGIENLKSTYSQDVQTIARLDTITAKIKRILNDDTITVNSNDEKEIDRDF